MRFEVYSVHPVPTEDGVSSGFDVAEYGHFSCPHNLLEVLQESSTFEGKHRASWRVDAGLLGEQGLHDIC